MSVKSIAVRFAAAGATFLTGAILVAGCGSDSDSISQDDFIAQANQICADYNDQSAQVQQDFQNALNSGDLEKAAGIAEDQADAQTAAVDDFEALGIPEGDEETINEFISISRDQTDTTLEVADAVRNDDGQALNKAIAKSNRLGAQSDQIASDYGLTDCVTPS